MKVSSLASGSAGNCFYILNEKKDKAILIDAGISCKQIETRLFNIGEDAKKVEAIFLTHEHADHIKGVNVFSKKFEVPVFGTGGTLKNSLINSQKVFKIKNDETVCVCGMDVNAFSKFHDAGDAVSYTIKNGNVASVITDIGKACKNSTSAINESDFLIIEANHDLDMLKNGRYPYFLKKRILGDYGHLSNLSSAIAVLEHSTSKLKNVVLAHLSKNNNKPNLALSAFDILKERSDLEVNVSVSLMDSPSELFLV